MHKLSWFVFDGVNMCIVIDHVTSKFYKPWSFVPSRHFDEKIDNIINVLLVEVVIKEVF